MSFKLVGEVVIDARKGTTALKSIQGEATRTSKSFDNAGRSTKNLAKSLLQLGSAGGNASRSFMQLARLGTAGIIGAGAVGAINKFGEAVKQAAIDYYETQKSLAGAFEQSFKSKSVDEARAGLEATEDIVEKLRDKLTKLGSLGKILGGLERLTGISLGVSDTQKELADTEALLEAQKQLVATRQEEAKIIKAGAEESSNVERTVKLNKILRQLDNARYGTQVDSNIELKAELELSKKQLSLINQQLEQLYKLKDVGVNIKLIDELTRKGREKDLEIAQKRLNLEQSAKKIREDETKKAQALSGGLLGASTGGRQALDSARKTRERENKQGNFKTQEAVFGKMTQEENARRAARGESPITMQAMKKRVATEQAAREAPSLANQIEGAMTGVDPSQIASGLAQSKFQKQSTGMASSLAPATGKLGEETKSQTPELLTAIQSLVDLMKSGTLVK
jgi:hypothetical protein